LSVAAVIPLFDGARYIETALASVFRQTVAPDEIIVVNDGSTDDGPAIVARLAAEHPILLLNQPNGGQSSARNAGVARASSDLIAFLDQDDVWYPTHIAELTRPFLSDDRLGWVYSNVDEIDDAGSLMKRSIHADWPGRHPKTDVVEFLSNDLGIFPSATLMRRAAIHAAGGFDERLSGYEDDDLLLRMFLAGYSNAYIPTPLCQWRYHGESFSFSRRMRQSVMIYAGMVMTRFPEHHEILAERFFRPARMRLYSAIKSRDREASRRYLEESMYFIKHMPVAARPRAYAQLLLRMARGALSWR
jgi:glycosyltransferase involved in cell wall biosynthesis